MQTTKTQTTKTQTAMTVAELHARRDALGERICRWADGEVAKGPGRSEEGMIAVAALRTLKRLREFTALQEQRILNQTAMERAEGGDA